MIEILNTLVSLDLFKEFFCCDLDKCHGLCCVEGDAGAPVTPDEVEMLEEAYEKLHEDLPLQAQQQIEKEGVVYPDKEGELVTQIINGKDCVFAKHEGACALCAIDSAYRNGKFHWQKPISCALYPVRLSTVGGMTAVNVHKWDVCQPARKLGAALHLPVYQFLKEPLIRRFGQAWWDECDIAARELKNAGYLD
ncbi:MAG: DUF3109 family protein [Bacteroidaceae bacterium]|jgi:hypothetical protein|nr:DUF3109 family protein [Bacteroidaceae bacterium]MCI6802910.1 DUF3109 family protein [Prevotellaceae bacterium]MBQ8710200.1 DUF3109 family protein [Bacteroidaceae bacterium]MBR1491399.1 DUF3109 family protein [Bacteroidaceae bacterium]MBS7322033.1 DUF3109 family protein [Bacteroidaceae bacterium]